MLAGVGPVPAVLFVVAADEGWMPQSAEHVAALDALGVRHGLLVVTRSDLADPAGPRRGRARTAGRHVAGRRPRGVRVSARDRRRPGRPAAPRSPTSSPACPHPTRRAACGCGSTARSRSAAPAPWSPARSPAGTLRVGDELELSARSRPRAGHRARPADASASRSAGSAGVARVAVNLRGVPRRGRRARRRAAHPRRVVRATEIDVRLSGVRDRVPDSRCPSS